MDIFLELLLPTIFVSLALLGVLFGYSLWVLLGGFSSVKKTVKDLAAATSTKDSGIPQWLRSNMAHWRGSDPGILVLIWIAYPIMLMLINNLTISTRDLEAAASVHSTPSTTHFGLTRAKEYSLIWRDVKLEVGGSVPGQPVKVILRGVSGAALPGELVALVGPSGAGKSTLLDILAMRLRPSSGSIRVGGKRRTATFRSISSYVPQESCFVPTLTVWETLGMNASLRIARKMDKEERDALMTGILSSMGLAKVKNSRVGGNLPGGFAIRGLSGGEQRRLHIACGVVAAPSLIFLDEPTSGLDSHAALVLMQHLQYLAHGGRTIISSVHQPRQAIWDMFDNLELLSEGYLMYYGPVHQVIDWFRNSLGYSYSVEKNGLPADWLLDLVSIGFHNSLYSYGFKSLDEVKAASEKFCSQLVLPSPALSPSRRNMSFDDAAGASTSSSVGVEAEPEEGKKMLCGLIPAPNYPTSFWNQLRWLMWRSLLAYLRNPADVAGRLLMYLFVGIMLGLIFLGDRRGPLAPLQMMMIVYFTLIPSALQPFTQMSLYIADRQFYIIDVAANLYSPLAYYMAQTITSIPFTVITAQALWLTMYGFINLSHRVEAILVGIVAQAVMSVLSIQVVVQFCYLLPNYDMAMLASITHATMTILLGGFVVQLPDLIPFMRAISFLFPLRYCFQIMMYLQLKGTSSESLLEYSGLTWSMRDNFLALLVLFLINCVCGYLTVVYLKRKRQMRR